MGKNNTRYYDLNGKRIDDGFYLLVDRTSPFHDVVHFRNTSEGKLIQTLDGNEQIYNGAGRVRLKAIPIDAKIVNDYVRWLRMNANALEGMKKELKKRNGSVK